MVSADARNSADGGEAILQAFRDLRIDYIFSSPGSEWPPLWEALARQLLDKNAGPGYIDCGHEMLAVGLAIGFTQVTGRLQAVVLHAGSGLLQGSMGINGAKMQELPMLVLSGESLSHGELADFDPGSQWYRNLGVVGGSARYLDANVKWASHIVSSETLYQSVVRTGELAQRTPRGPTYLCVPMETMIAEWTPPRKMQKAAAVPILHAAPDDIRNLAQLIAKANTPIIITESAGRDPHAFAALVELAEYTSIPVVENSAAGYANFPKRNPLYLGFSQATRIRETDLAILVESRAPWYPPSNAPRQGQVISISENPIKGHMVYQNLGADGYLEGNVAQNLRALTEELKNIGISAEKRDERRANVEHDHRLMIDKLEQSEQDAEAQAKISVPLLCKRIAEHVPADTVFVDETIVHSGSLRAHLNWQKPQSFFRPIGGLGQGLGISLGIKLAKRDSFVTLIVGDGSFLYNPVLSCLAFAKRHKLPILIIILDNGKYEIMRRLHLEFYPKGLSASSNHFHGVDVDSVDNAKLAAVVEGYGENVESTERLGASLKEAVTAVKSGRIAILNVSMNE